MYMHIIIRYYCVLTHSNLPIMSAIVSHSSNQRVSFQSSRKGRGQSRVGSGVPWQWNWFQLREREGNHTLWRSCYPDWSWAIREGENEERNILVYYTHIHVQCMYSWLS